MNETQLQIIISLVDEATAQLGEVGAALQGMAGQASDAAQEMTSSLSTAEEQVVAQAEAVAKAWSGAADSIPTDFEEIVPTTDELIQSLVETNQQAAAAVALAWKEQSAALEESLAAAIGDAEAPAVAEATTVGEAAGTAAGTGFAGYFKDMIVGYIGLQIGSWLSGGIAAAVQAAQQQGNQIATVKAQISQQTAEIQVNEAALQKWTGTTAEVNAAHAKAAANITAEKEKIKELTEQLGTLQTQQQGLPGQVESIGNSILTWIGQNKSLESGIQSFMTTLGSMITVLSGGLIGFTLLKIAGGALADMFGVVGVTTAGASALFAIAVVGILVGIALVIMGIENLVNKWSFFVENCEIAWTDIKALFNEGVDALGKIFDSWGSSISDWVTTFWQSVKTDFQGGLNSINAIWQSTWNGISSFFGSMWKDLQTAIQGGITFIEGLLTNLLSFASGITSKVLAPIQAIANIAGPILSAIGGAIGTGLSGITKMATGGIVSTPTLALVGEAGPEAVIPLSAFTGGTSLGGGGGGLGGGNGNIVININGGSYLDQGGATMIANALATQIGRQLKLKNYV